MPFAFSQPSSLASLWFCFYFTYLVVPHVRADPSLFNSATCTSHPTTALKKHGAPSTDTAITFSVKNSAGSAVTTLCAGSWYTAKVSFSQSREALLTASQGSLGGTGSCPNKRTYDSAATSQSANLTIACSLTGSVTLMVTSSAGQTSAFKQNSATFPISGSCGCGGASSPPPPGASTSSPSPTTTTPSTTPTPTTTSPPASPTDISTTTPSPPPPTTDATALSPSTSGSSACGASSLGYACALTVKSGVVLHWTAGGSSPPDNVCTASSAASSTSTSSDLVHLAITSTQSGYASLSFAEEAGVMSPADAIIGYLEGGVAKLRYYALDGYDLGSALDGSWVLHAGVAAPSSGGTTLCFSVAAAMATGRRRRGRALQQTYTLDATALQLNWAVSDSNALDGHTDYGGLALNALSGSASVKINEGRNRAAIAHGALMIIAWVLLLPVGVLAARHRWLSLAYAKIRQQPTQQLAAVSTQVHPEVPVGKPRRKDRWYVAHMWCQILGLVLFVIGLAIAFAKLDSEAEEGPAFAHEVLGLMCAGLALLQFVVAWLRPGPGAPRRPLWNFLHHYTGRTAALLAWVAVGLGIYLAHTSYDHSLAGWLVPTIIIIGGLAGADAALTWAKHALAPAMEALMQPGGPTTAAAAAAAVPASVELQPNGGGYGGGYGYGYANGGGSGYGIKASRVSPETSATRSNGGGQDYRLDAPSAPPAPLASYPYRSAV